MKAVVVQHYGPPEVAVIEERPDPTVRANEVLIRVEAVSVTAGDARIRGARFPRGFGFPARLAFGLRGPRNPILGSAFSGVIEWLGSDVTEFAIGDEVAGMNGAKMGFHAQRAAIKASRIVRKPPNVSHVDAAATLFGGTTAMHFLRDRVTPGTRVLVNGASGGVGTSAVQLAALAGAEVTAVTSTPNAPLTRRLGATHTIDYRAQPIASLPPGGFDFVFDAVGNIDRALGLRLASPTGFAALAVADLQNTIRASGRVLASPSQEAPNDITKLLSLIGAGKLDSVAQSFGGLAGVVEAYRLIDSGRKVGNAVVQPWR